MGLNVFGECLAILEICLQIQHQNVYVFRVGGYIFFFWIENESIGFEYDHE